MNRLTVRDLVVMGGSAVMAISAFLPYYSYPQYNESFTTWHQGSLDILVLGFLAGVAAGVLVAVERFTPAGDVGARIGLGEGRLPAVLAVVSFLTLALTALPAPVHGIGQWLGLLAAVVLLVGTALAGFIPALATPVNGGSPAAGPGPGVSSFWFSVAAPAVVHDRATGAPRSNLQPGRWYLATASYGTAWEVSDQEFGTAVLHDLSGAQLAR